MWKGFWHIAREKLESEYSWESEGVRKLEISSIGDNLEYLKSIIDLYYTHANIHTHTHTHTHIYIYIYIYTHTHTHTRKKNS